MHLPDDRGLAPHEPLADRGLDSLMATELTRTLREDGIDVSLGPRARRAQRGGARQPGARALDNPRRARAPRISPSALGALRPRRPAHKGARVDPPGRCHRWGRDCKRTMGHFCNGVLDFVRMMTLLGCCWRLGGHLGCRVSLSTSTLCPGPRPRYPATPLPRAHRSSKPPRWPLHLRWMRVRYAAAEATSDERTREPL